MAREARAVSAQHELDENIKYHDSLSEKKDEIWMDDLQDQYELLKLSRIDPWFDRGRLNYIKDKKKMDTNKLFQLTTRAVCHLYAEDPTKPSLVVSFLPNKKFYISVVRYRDRLAKGKEVVHKVQNEDFEEAVKEIAEWVSENKQNNPLDDLKEFLK